MMIQLPTALADFPTLGPVRVDASTRPRARLARLTAAALMIWPCLGPVALAARAKPAKKTVRKQAAGYTQAGRLYAAKKYDQALAAYQKYLKDTPNIRPATRALAEQKIGLCLAGLKQYDQALHRALHRGSTLDS